MTVYLIHFSEGLHHANHYIGFTSRDDVDDRLREHLSGRGARLTRAAVESGISLQVVCVWPDADRSFERYLKKRKKARRLCPICMMSDNNHG